jgi:hypothetical protein
MKNLAGLFKKTAAVLAAAFVFYACGNTVAPLPSLPGTVSISGTARVGETLAAETGSLGGEGVISYQWQSGDSADGDFTTLNENSGNPDYTPVSADVGNYLRVAVTRDGYNGTVTSAPVGPVAAAVVPNRAYTVTANGTSNTTNTTVLTFAFNGAVDGLTAGDITLANGTGTVTKGALAGEGNSRSLGVTVTAAGDITVSITRAGIESGTKTVTVHKAGEPTPDPVTYEVSANGTSNTEDTTTLTFTFSEAVADLTAEDITLADGTGTVTKGELAGEGDSRSLSVTVTGAGDITVSITKAGIESDAKTVTVHKAGEPTPDPVAYEVSADGTTNTTDTTALTFGFSEAISDLETTDISITPAGYVTTGALTGSGTNWALSITAVNTAGELTVSITKAGIESGAKTVTVHKADEPAPDPVTYGVTADGELDTTNTTTLTFTFSGAVVDLDVGDITLADGTGAVAKGLLSGGGTSWTLGVTVDTAGDITVSIAKADIESGPKTVTVHKAAPPLPALGGTVSITGTLTVEETLSADTTGLTNAVGALSYVWKFGNTDSTVDTVIDGATGATLVLTAALEGKYVAVTVTASESTGAVTGVSAEAVAAAVVEVIVNSADDTEDEGTLRYALTNAVAGDVISVNITDPTPTITLTKALPQVNVSITIKGNGVTLTQTGSWAGTANNTALLYINSSTAIVKISGVHFKNGKATTFGGGIHSEGTLTLESCIFSGNAVTASNCTGGAIYAANTLTIQGCTFYNNTSASFAGAVAMPSKVVTLTLTGNLFYNSGGSNNYGLVRVGANVTINASYNVVDRAFGTASGGCGWDSGTGDKTLTECVGNNNSPVVDTTTFAPVSGLGNFLSTAPADFPVTDFHGATRSYPGAPGAVAAQQ